jgi:RimJ/RimL family protein N-acetyltransferase
MRRTTRESGSLTGYCALTAPDPHVRDPLTRGPVVELPARIGTVDAHDATDPLVDLADDRVTLRPWHRFTVNYREFAATGNPTGVAFAIADAASGELVGCCGVDDWTGQDVAQFGYWVAAPARGQGYATRAAILVTRWLFELGAARVFLTIVAGNHGSAAVARRAGFEHEGTMRDYGIWQGRRCDVMVFAALAIEWAP